MLDLRRLAVFHEVAERGSFSGAATALDYTQSVVSHHVAQLERELGVTLFERTRRPVRLTAAGELLSEHASRVLGAARGAEAELRAVAGLEGGVLRIGAYLSACASFVPAAIGAFAARHPRVQTRLEQVEPPDALRRLISGDLDVAVVYREEGTREVPDPRLEDLVAGHDPYRVVLHPAHRLARRRSVPVAELRDESFTAPRGSGAGTRYHAMLESLCAAAGFRPRLDRIVDDVAVGRAFVAAGLAVGVMPEMTIAHPRPDVAVRPLAGDAPGRTVHVVGVRGRRVPGVAELTETLREAAARRLGDLARAG